MRVGLWVRDNITVPVTVTTADELGWRRVRDKVTVRVTVIYRGRAGSLKGCTQGSRALGIGGRLGGRLGCRLGCGLGGGLGGGLVG